MRPADEVLAEHLPRARAHAESMMVDECVIERPDGVTADPETGADVVVSSQVYAGRCRVRDRAATVARESDVAGADVDTRRLEIHVPVGTGPYRTGDVVAARGRRFRVLAPHDATFQTAIRLPVEEWL